MTLNATISALDLERLAVANALSQPLYRAAIAEQYEKRSQWARAFSLIKGRFAGVIRSFNDQLSGGIARDRVINGLGDVEIADLEELVGLSLARGSAGITDLFETALSPLIDLLGEIDAEVISLEARQDIGKAVALARRTLRDVAQIDAIELESRTTEFSAEVLKPGASRNAGGLYEVWFGTNRRPIWDGGSLTGFSGERDEKVHLGRCAVEIPATHRIGSTGSSWWRRLLRGDDRLKLSQTVQLGQDDFWLDVKRRLAIVGAKPNDAIVFLHGYNVSFEAAAIRAAQIGADLSLPGMMAFFSWPSQGKLLGYIADAATIDASEQAITDFLNDFCERSGAGAIHLIAHSMGNRGLLRAVQRISQRVADQTKRPFGQIVLAAADVDTDVFRNLAGAYSQVADRTTLYVSAGDRAVLGSRIIHAANRVGLTPPVCVVAGIDTINVTNVDLTELGHGYVASSREVLTDMYSILTSDMPPARRATLRRAGDDDANPYWEFAR